MKMTGLQRMEKKLEKQLGAPGFAWVGSQAVLRGEMIKGLEVLRNHSAAAPHDLLAQIALGRAELLDGLYREALDRFEEVVLLDRSAPGGWSGLLEAAKYLGEEQKAQEARQMLQLLDPFFFSQERVVENSADSSFTLDRDGHSPSEEGVESAPQESALFESDLDDFVLNDILGNVESMGNIEIPVTQVAALLDQQEESDEKTAEAAEQDATVGEEELFVAPVSGSDVSSAIDALFGDDTDDLAGDQLLDTLVSTAASTSAPTDALSEELGKLLQEEIHESLAPTKEGEEPELSVEGKQLLDSIFEELQQTPVDEQESAADPQELEDALAGLDSIFEVEESPQIEIPSTTPPPELAESPVASDEMADAVSSEIDALFGDDEEQKPTEAEQFNAAAEEPHAPAVEPASDPMADAVTSELDALFAEVEKASSNGEIKEESDSEADMAALDAAAEEPFAPAVEPASDPMADAVSSELDALFAEDNSPFESGFDLEESEPIDELVEAAVEPAIEPPPAPTSNEMDALLSDLDEISTVDLEDSSLSGTGLGSEGGIGSGSRLSSTETMAEIYAAQGHFAEALKILEELERERPNDPAIRERIQTLQQRQQEQSGREDRTVDED